MIIASAVALIVNGDASQIAEQLVAGADGAIRLTLELAGSYLLWMGLMNVASRAGLTAKLAALMRRPLRWLMPEIGNAAAPVTLNLAANFFGLGNAATPFGIQAMKELNAHNGSKTHATREICTFLVLNASAIELLPTSVIAVRAACGAVDPYSIVVPTFLSSVACALTGVLACRVFEELRR